MLRLTADGRTAIRRMSRGPEFAEVGGTCCWRVYARYSHRGQSEVIPYAWHRKRITFPIKSVKMTTC